MANSSVHFPGDVVERLNRVAERDGVSRNRVIVTACERYLDEAEARWPPGFFSPLPEDERRELSAAMGELQERIARGRKNREGPPF